MPVRAYISRDPSGNPWPPAHEHEAAAAIGLIQRLHEAVDHEPALYAVFVNLQAPSADLVVLTEMGMGVVELKHYAGRLAVVAGDWYAERQLIKAGAAASTPREQVQNYAARIRRDLETHIAGFWSVTESEVATKLKIQTAVCFTNPEAVIEPAVKTEIEREAHIAGRRWSAFQLLTPPDFAAWVSALRFGMEQGRSAQFAPYRLKAKEITALGQAYFKSGEWTEIRNLMPTAQPYGYLAIHHIDQELQLVPLRTTDVTIGRDGAKCAVMIPEAYKRTSREHLRLTRVANYVWATDLSSSHGTFVNGKRIEKPTRLKPGQRITLGGPEPSERVCALALSAELPPELRAAATAGDATTIEPEE